MQKKKIFLFLFVLIALAGLVCVFCFLKDKKEEIEAPILGVEKTFDEMVLDFNAVYKKALIYTSEGKQESVAEIEKALALWLEVERKFSSELPREYQKTESWEDKLNNISDLGGRALSFAKEGELEKSYKELESIRRALKNIRLENGISNISDLFLDLNDVIIVVDGAESKRAALESFGGLKMIFTKLKEIKRDENYQKALEEIGDIISGMENSTEKTFPKHQKKLRPAFIKIYLDFG